MGPSCIGSQFAHLSELLGKQDHRKTKSLRKIEVLTEFFVLITRVIFGMLVSLPITLLYYILLGL